MPTKLTLDAIEVLDAIDSKGSFAAAAAALYRVPSAVTYTVRKLEEDLGVALFRKEGRRAVLTPAGEHLLTQGRAILLAADRVVEQTRQVSSGWESCLNVAIDSILSFDGMFALLDDFYQEKPDIDINLYEEVLGGAWEAIIDGRVDIVLGASEPAGSTRGLTFERIMDVEWCFAVARNHPLAQQSATLKAGETIDKTALQAYRAVVVRDSSRHLPPLTRRVLAQQAILRVANIGQKIRAQVAGLGVGFLPRHRVQDLLDNGQLVAIPLQEAEPPSPLYLVWRKHKTGRALCWFVDRLRVMAREKLAGQD